MVFDTPMFRISALYLDFEGTKNIDMSWYGALEDASGSWLESGIWFGILILIWIWSLAFDKPIFWILQVLDLSLDLVDAKSIYVFYGMIAVLEDSGGS